MRFSAARKEFDFIRNFAELIRRSFSVISKALAISVTDAKKSAAFFLGEFLHLLDVFFTWI